MMLGVVDTLLLGNLSVEALGASALANMWGWGSLALGMGVVLGIDPLISQAHGDGDSDGAALALQRGIVVALLISIPVGAAWLFTGPGLILLGQDPEIARLAQTYNVIRAPSVPFFLVFTALRSWLAGRSVVAPAMWVSIFVNVLNLFFAWALIFGRLGFPRLELVGAAWVASVVTILQPILLFALIRVARLHEGAWRAWDRRSFELRGLWQIAFIGLPVALQISLEGWAWSLSTMMAGWIGTAALGGHIIVLNLASLSFQVPLGVALAASVRVGNRIGAGDAVGARQSATVALVLGAGVMLFFAVVFAVLRHGLPRLYSSDVDVLALAALVMPIAGAFQLFDGTQVVAGGILRGTGRTQVPALVNLIGFYGISLPLSWIWAFGVEGGLEGIWWGLVVGLFAVSLALVLWLRRTLARPITELRVGVH
jgi:MATE family multidrug resistance protein